jgi:hypothetical protein
MEGNMKMTWKKIMLQKTQNGNTTSQEEHRTAGKKAVRKILPAERLWVKHPDIVVCSRQKSIRTA